MKVLQDALTAVPFPMSLRIMQYICLDITAFVFAILTTTLYL
jgi:hypothetical protein